MHTQKPRLPVRQLLILSICRFAEPVALTSFLPYLPEMMESLGVHKSDVPKWVGITTAVSSFSQATMAVSWGTASDTYGRKPIILMGLTFTMIFSLVFGMAKSLPMLVVSRGMIGLMNGNVGIIRTMVAEMVQDRDLQPRAFSIMPLVWTIGSIFGPAFGGALARPADKHPEFFGHSSFFKNNPFILPNMVAACFFIVGITTGFLFLHETLAAKKGHRDPGLVLGKILARPCSGRRSKVCHDDENTPLLGEQRQSVKSSTVQVKARKHSWGEVLSPQSVLILTVYTLMSLHTMAFDSLLPVFLHTPPQRLEDNPDVRLPFKFAGGFGIDSQEIGVFYTLTGIIGMVVQFLVFPAAVKRFGVLTCLKVVFSISPIIYLLTPYIALVPESMREVAIFCLILSKLTANIFGFPCTTILLTNSARSMSILGTLNGIGTSVSAIGRASGPAMMGQVFSIGVRMGYMIIPWWFLAVISALSAIPVMWIEETDGFQGNEPEPETETEPEAILGAESQPQPVDARATN
ncbi:hypothetical protein P175DRAFT_0478513 [Aspergillus ochraceoroseus IBT 24754]|uniref:Major facilitator superfamily (MFS) profile domain-containing protein n=2 Tax=Aspergillus ochraceoroseus TaxID=138278 RepID=A0A2T5LWA0_9EURO|nr:uncharacterized protein P175DRAFT_0478513 [Aspergillus ochraceoroseus IBT 24754]KKK15386.1 hypothetical protein AOCH_003948 [Aspergillus ochraceoroseus]PTU20564.1 hypothetical protein P175DRAFT_0478513 [Aspergillus ochraceoroseus IBT 24754]